MTGYRYAAAPGYVSPCQPSRPSPSPTAPRGTYSYLPHNATAEESRAHNLRAANETDTRHRSLLRPPPQASNPRRSKSQVSRRDGSSDESNGLLRVQTPPGSHRRTLSQTSRSPPSLTHSSDNESEGRATSGPSTPRTFKAPLWTDSVSVVSDATPMLLPLPSAAPNLKTPYKYAAHTTHHPTKPPTLLIPPTQPISYGSGLTKAEKARAEIEDVDSKVQLRVSSFTFPDTLDVEWQSQGEAPLPLSYTARNKELIRHRDYLEKSLSRLNAISSHGDTRVRDTRRRVANKIRGQLEDLNRMEKMVRDNIHYERWKKQTPVPLIRVTAPAEVSG